jgi:hypothetical protein
MHLNLSQSGEVQVHLRQRIRRSKVIPKLVYRCTAVVDSVVVAAIRNIDITNDVGDSGRISAAASFGQSGLRAAFACWPVAPATMWG